MQRFLEMLTVVGVLYIAYKLTLSQWNYSTEADRKKRKNLLKKKGLSNRFYFMGARTLWLLNICSGGLFCFYWFYKQWQMIFTGFKRLDGRPLSASPFWRALGGFFTFFSLGGIINRTCEYLRKRPALPAALWGLMWWGGLVATFLPTELWVRICGYLLFCAAPAAFQNRLNALLEEPLPLKPKPAEIVATTVGLLVTLTAVLLVRVL